MSEPIAWVLKEAGMLIRWLLDTVVLVLVLLVITSSCARADSRPSWGVAESFGGVGSDWANAITADDRGNAYVTGYFADSATFLEETLTSAGGADMFLAKFVANGRLGWLLQIGGLADDAGKDIALDRAGNIYVTGWFTGTATFPSVRGASRTAVGEGETVFLAKYRSNGTLDWLRTGHAATDFPGLNRGHGVAVERATGAVYVTGVAQTDTVFESLDGSEHVVPGPVTWHMFLVKYDAAGNFQWGQWNEASPNSIPHKVAVEADGSAYITGWFEGAATFHGSNGQDRAIAGLSGTVQVFPYPEDAFIAKYDGDGNVQWVNQIGGYKAIGADIAASGEGRISITGFIGNVNFEDFSQAETIVTSQPGGTNISLGGGQFTDPYNPDVFIATYDTAGVLIDARRIGEAQNDGGSGIAYDRDGNLYVAGVFRGAVDFEGRTVPGDRPSNLFVLKYTRDRHTGAATNELEWVRKAEGVGTEQFEANPRMCVTPGGAVLVAGAYRDTAVFDDTALHSAGEEDIFLSELRPRSSR